SIPLVPAAAPSTSGAAAAPLETDGELRAVGFELRPLWRALGLTGPVTRLSGRGALDANVRALLGGRGAGLYTHGRIEFRNLKWGPGVAIGGLQGIVASTPGVWRVDPIRGALFGGE